jgi:two-component system sensor histidine kinase UhpB
MLAPLRRWWIYLLATSAGAFLAHSTAEPVLFAILVESANYTKAAVAGAGVRRFGDMRLDTLRSMAVFLLFAVFLGPLLAAFLGAALAVTLNGAGNYGLVWRGWFLSNALTGLTLLPIIVIAFTRRKAWTRLRVRRLLEAALLYACLVAVGLYVFDLHDAQPSGLPARLYAPLPLLLWAAVRFGPAGTCAALLTLTSLAIGGALQSHGPFVGRSAGENILELQLFLMAISLPLLLLAAVVEERRNKARALRDSEAALRASYEQVQNLVGRLITAQEAERTFIARELHDDVCQRLAGLVLKLDQLKTQIAAPAPDLLEEAAGAQAAAFQITETVRNISHELHPGTLRYIGLVDSLRDHCNRFSGQHGIKVTMSATRDLGDVPAELALCLYRVTQEALRNVAVHAQAGQASVELRRGVDALELLIADDGKGFDPELGIRSGGLGLISLDERVRLVGGTVTIQSQSEGGTQLHVQVPMNGATAS